MSGTPMLIDPASVERIEVIKGPNSVLYGSDAIGGVINIITKRMRISLLLLILQLAMTAQAMHGVKVQVFQVRFQV